MDVQASHDGKTGRMIIRGEVDFYQTIPIRDALRDFIDSGIAHIIVDLEDVPYMDSSGVGTFIGVLERVQEMGGGIAFLNAQSSLVQVFELIKMKSQFLFCTDEAEVLSAWGRSA